MKCDRRKDRKKGETLIRKKTVCISQNYDRLYNHCLGFGAMDSPEMVELEKRGSRANRPLLRQTCSLAFRSPRTFTADHGAASGGDRWTLVVKVSAPSGDPRSEWSSG